MTAGRYGLTVTSAVATTANVENQRRDAQKQLALPQQSMHDSYLDKLFKAAVDLFESQTSRSIIETTWALTLPTFPDSDVIFLPRNPVMSVESITYLDTDGNSQTLSTDTYVAQTTSEPGLITKVYGQSWPTTKLAHPEGVTVSFKAGYSADYLSVPMLVRLCLMFMIDEWFRDRSPVSVITPGIRDMLNAHSWGDEFYTVG